MLCIWVYKIVIPVKTGIQTFSYFVDQILTAKQQPPSSPFSKGELSIADTSSLEKQIDDMVYVLCGLTPEEITIVEGKN
jgi:hypothetical protein